MKSIKSKKIVNLLGIATIGLLSLVSCSSTDDLLFSKYYESSSASNNLVEIYNNGTKSVNLSSYNLSIYSNDSKVANYTIKLSGKIASNKYYVVGTDKNNITSIKDKIDLGVEDLKFNGDDAIVLSKGSKVIDALGDYINGSGTQYGKDCTLIRKLDHYKSSTIFNQYDYIYYIKDLFGYLKNDNFEIKTDQDLIPGPRLKQEYKDKAFLDQNSLGEFGLGSQGGATPAKFNSHVDGDTTKVTIPLLTGSNITDTNSIRYYWNQTPESTTNSSVNPQAWGYPASNLIKQIVTAITPSDEFLVQSAPGTTITDAYSRYLGLLWLNGQCLNYINVRAGTTQFTGSNTDELGWYDYKEVSYYGWFLNAELRAANNKWGIWNDYRLGQPSGDPMWDYANEVRLVGADEYYPPLHDEITVI